MGFGIEKDDRMICGLEDDLIFNSGIGVESVRQFRPVPGETQYEKT